MKCARMMKNGVECRLNLKSSITPITDNSLKVSETILIDLRQKFRPQNSHFYEKIAYFTGFFTASWNFSDIFIHL
jgi:hypothetical protein